MIRQFLDWIYCKLFGRKGYQYKTSPIERSILKVLARHDGLIIPEIAQEIKYVDLNVFFFEGILERLEMVGLVRYENGRWYKRLTKDDKGREGALI